MKTQWEQECADVRAALVALQHKLHVLETKETSAPIGARGRPRWRLSKSMTMGWFLAVALVAAGGAVYGQGAVDALFIDKDGNVGIGEKNPGEKLHVTGGKIQLDGNQQLKFTDADSTNNLKLQLRGGYGLGINGGALFYAADGKHSWRDNGGTNERMTLTTGAGGGLSVLGTGTSFFGGNVGVGAPVAKSKLDVRGTALVQSLSFADAGGEAYADNWIGMSDNFPDKTKRLHIGGITDGGVRRLALWADITTVAGKLDVDGAINGEKPPMVFEVGQKNDTTNYHHVEQDIGVLCGDADGCTMKFLLRHSLTDEVRTISEQIYIEQADKSNNKSPGLHGYTRQLGGGDQEFVLQTAGQYEIVPHPWAWIWVLNYSHEYVGPKSSAYSGYKVQFMTHPHVTATVIIYDR